MVPDESFSTPPGKRSPAWQSAYEAVLKESDTGKLFKLVEVAEAAARTRRAEVKRSAGRDAEKRALDEALANLQIVKKERLKFL